MFQSFWSRTLISMVVRLDVNRKIITDFKNRFDGTQSVNIKNLFYEFHLVILHVPLKNFIKIVCLYCLFQCFLLILFRFTFHDIMFEQLSHLAKILASKWALYDLFLLRYPAQTDTHGRDFLLFIFFMDHTNVEKFIKSKGKQKIPHEFNSTVNQFEPK